MPRHEQILTVFVASPSDVAAERARLEEVVAELNQTWSRNLGIRLDLIRWETHAYPGFGIDAQEVINRQVPSDYDIFIGIMWHRFGTPTGRADSGTEEEFLRAKAKWDADNTAIDLMVYFKDAPVSPSQIDTTQLAKVAEFRKSLGAEGGLYWSFQSTDDFANLLRLHLSRVVQKWQASLSMPRDDTASKPAPEPSSAAMGDTSDEEEAGLLELSEEFEDAFREATDIITRIAKATENIGQKIEEHAKRAQFASAAGPLTRSAAKRLISKAAKDMNDYAARLNQDVPLLRNCLQSGMGLLSKAIALWPDFMQQPTFHDQAGELVKAIQQMRSVLATSEAQTQRFLESVKSLPRLTAELNKAKRSVSGEIEGLINLFQTQQQLLVQSETAVSELLNKQEEL